MSFACGVGLLAEFWAPVLRSLAVDKPTISLFFPECRPAQLALSCLELLHASLSPGRTPGQLHPPLVNMAARRPGRAGVGGGGGGVPLSPSQELRAGPGWPAGQLPSGGNLEGGPGGCRVGRARRGLGRAGETEFNRLEAGGRDWEGRDGVSRTVWALGKGLKY